MYGILWARIMEWVAIPFSRGSSQPRDRTQVSCIAGGVFIRWATREPNIRCLNQELLCRACSINAGRMNEGTNTGRMNEAMSQCSQFRSVHCSDHCSCPKISISSFPSMFLSLTHQKPWYLPTNWVYFQNFPFILHAKTSIYQKWSASPVWTYLSPAKPKKYIGKA